ncbi:MAG: hypothetical protein HDR08_14460 [Lachnospiraceae bacterium]|nr:hypothetical protein [Lachnospiraceae bacterium]
MKISGDYQGRTVQYCNDKNYNNRNSNVSEVTEEAASLEISKEGRNAFALKDKNEFWREVKHYDKSINYLPEYSGIFSADKTIAAALENCSKDEQAFVYDIIRQNFLVKNSASMTEKERQANISLGMKKAEYAAENLISQDSRDGFLDAMETIAKLASAGKADSDGNMDYGVKAGKYLGHGSNLVYTTDAFDMMRTMDSDAYAEYQKIDRESTNENRTLNTMRYLSNWYAKMVKVDNGMVGRYESKSDKYVAENVKNKKLDTTFANIETDSKISFLESLRAFQSNNPNFLSLVIQRELSMIFWNR